MNRYRWSDDGGDEDLVSGSISYSYCIMLSCHLVGGGWLSGNSSVWRQGCGCHPGGRQVCQPGYPGGRTGCFPYSQRTQWLIHNLLSVHFECCCHGSFDRHKESGAAGQVYPGVFTLSLKAALSQNLLGDVSTDQDNFSNHRTRNSMRFYSFILLQFSFHNSVNSCS